MYLKLMRNNSLYFNNIIIIYLNHYDVNIDKLEIDNTKMFSERQLMFYSSLL